MRLYDCEQSAQEDVLDSGGEYEFDDGSDKKQERREKFGAFKFD
jgi:hypothetical protein